MKDPYEQKDAKHWRARMSRKFPLVSWEKFDLIDGVTFDEAVAAGEAYLLKLTGKDCKYQGFRQNQFDGARGGEPKLGFIDVRRTLEIEWREWCEKHDAVLEVARDAALDLIREMQGADTHPDWQVQINAILAPLAEFEAEETP